MRSRGVSSGRVRPPDPPLARSGVAGRLPASRSLRSAAPGGGGITRAEWPRQDRRVVGFIAPHMEWRCAGLPVDIDRNLREAAFGGEKLGPRNTPQEDRKST